MSTTIEKTVITWNQDITLHNVVSLDENEEVVYHEAKHFQEGELTIVEIEILDQHNVDLNFEDGTFCFPVPMDAFD
jgi:hypothetical protein